MTNTLFCGIGSHASGVFTLAQQFQLQNIYIIYSQFNTDEFVVKIENLKREIAEMNEKLNNNIHVFYIQIEEHDVIKSFDAVYDLYFREKDNHIITDLTAGHKSISVLLWYAHHFIQRFAKSSKLVYFPYNKKEYTIYPQLPYQTLSLNEENFLKDVYAYHQQNIVTEDAKHMKLSAFLASNGYSRPSISRYRDHLASLGYMNENDEILISGYFYLRGNNLI